ncbi:MAG: GNAT family protein [Vicinamibacterales bacterium]
MIRTATGIVTMPAAGATVTTTNWRNALPVLQAGELTLRELRLSDAASLLQMLSTEEVSRFISPPPTTVAGFERFITWAQQERNAGRYICYGIVPAGSEDAVGIIQVRQLGLSMQVVEWGFAIGSQFWGSGLFQTAARVVLQFTFGALGTTRVEARSSILNGRGNGALQKLGATREGVLRKSFLRDGVYHDQVLWSIVSDDWWEWMCRASATRN